MDVPSLTAGQLALRAATTEDLEHFVSLDEDAEVMRYLVGAAVPADVSANAWDQALRGDDARRDLRYWHGSVDGAFVGWWSLHTTRPDPLHASAPAHAEVGYRLARPAWGRGLATTGLRAVVSYAFAELVVQRVWAETMAVNAGSRRVLEKAGLQHVRTYLRPEDTVPGADEGEVVYELWRADWERAVGSAGLPG